MRMCGNAKLLPYAESKSHTHVHTSSTYMCRPTRKYICIVNIVFIAALVVASAVWYIKVI